MADISKYERKQTARRGQSDAGDHDQHRSERSASKAGKRGLKASNSSPWAYGRETQQEKNYSADYSRRSSNKAGLGPAKPADAIPGNIYAPGKSSRDGQKKHV